MTPGHIYTPRQLRIIIVGAGPSGLFMAYKLQRDFVQTELIVYEKHDDIGGTWYKNRYPGCRCDVPAHNYVWSFDQYEAFPETYSTSEEIWKYFKSFETRNHLTRLIKTSHEVINAEWHQGQAVWSVCVRDLKTSERLIDTCDVFINACGFLHRPAWPSICGLENFKGSLIHTAEWHSDIDVRDKHVAVIGNGSSGIQIIPAVLNKVKTLTCIMRGPTWVSSLGSGFRRYTNAEIEQFETHPKDLQMLRKWLEHTANQNFSLFMDHSVAQREIREQLTSHMKNVLADHPQSAKLIPDWPVGCRRLSPGHGFLEALQDQKCTVILSGVQKVLENSIMVEGKTIYTDAIICATGFDASFVPKFPISANGTSLAEKWQVEPAGYLGIAVADFPNYFTLLGPNSPLGNGPVLVSIEAQASYVCKVINRIQTQSIKHISVKESAVRDFIAFKDQFMAATVWNSDCTSWYKQKSGKISALWPGSTLHYLETMQEVRYDDFEVVYSGNRFSYLGNGQSRLEQSPDADLSHYIRLHDDGPSLGSRFEYDRKPAGF